MRITPDRMLGVLGAAAKPAKVWPEQFDYCEEVLVRLARTDWDKVDEGDFSYYFLDLAHSDLQPDLFRHVFPACLKYWYDTLMRDAYAGRFHYALVQDQILEEMLSRTLRPLSGLHFWQSLAERQPNVLADHTVGALHPRKAGTSGGGSSG